MKKILIVTLGMEIGGAERSLITLLSELDYSKVQVDLFLLHKKGPLLKYIPKEVNVMEENEYYSQLAIPLIDVIRNGKFSIVLGRLYAKFKAKYYNMIHGYKNESYVELEYSHKYTKRMMPLISDKKYDLVISYLTPHYFATEKTHGKVKIAWIHTDYTNIKCDIDSEYKMWNKYDKIVSISSDVKNSFIKKFPQLEPKIIMIENTVSKNYIMNLANQDKDFHYFSKNTINILSVGRLCYPKNFESIPEICKYLRKDGYDIKWYIIGSGESHDLILYNINKFEMDEVVILLGQKTNPYPYIKNCDIYIQPSRYEGKAITVLEAQALEKPVIITNYKTANSQLKNYENGFIVELEPKKCAKGIEKIIDDDKLRKKVINNCKSMRFPNDYHILYELIQ